MVSYDLKQLIFIFLSRFLFFLTVLALRHRNAGNLDGSVGVGVIEDDGLGLDDGGIEAVIREEVP